MTRQWLGGGGAKLGRTSTSEIREVTAAAAVAAAADQLSEQVLAKAQSTQQS